MEQILILKESDLRQVLTDTIQNVLESFKPVEKPNDSELITRFEAADLLGISLPTLSAYSKSGRVKSYRIGSRVRYKRSEVLNALQEVQTYKYR